MVGIAAEDALMRKITFIILSLLLIAPDATPQRKTHPKPKSEITRKHPQPKPNPYDAIVETATNPDVAALEKRIRFLERKIIELDSKQTQDEYVELDTTKDSYSRVNSNNGTFLVRVMKVEPYLNGYRVVLGVGNITTATFRGCDLTVTWGTKEPDYSDNWNAWFKSLRTKDEHFNTVLLPGNWNEVVIILVPAKADELAYFQLSMRTNSLSLL